ncbi:MAG TPA: glycoside hydrolase family 76 protein [Solirubrobacterales bacterium]|nr:glycoside hydrolase family 76 protein [Solirubrobacterales bacterium]
MHRDFGAGHNLLREVAGRPGRAPFAYAWGFSQALAADIAIARAMASPAARARVRRDLSGLNHYWNNAASPPAYDCAVTPPLMRGGARFFDDNAWIGLDLVHAYELDGDPLFLQRAEQVFAFTESGWDADPSHPDPGGVFWADTSSNRDRATVSTAGAAQLGLELYLANGDRAELEAATSMLAWVDGTLRAPNGLYWDHVDLRGRIDTKQWSYNQGQMLGAYALLYRATGDPAALGKAEAIASASLQKFRASGFHAQPAIFNAIYFRNLERLDLMAPHGLYARAMRSYAASIDRRTPRRTGLTQTPGAHLLDQAAVVAANADLALLERKSPG